MPEPSARDVAGPPCLDVLVLDEDAILTRPRGRWEIPSLDESRASEVPHPLVRRPRDGRLLCRAAPSHRDTDDSSGDAIWQETAYCAHQAKGVLAVIPTP
jgi:hypothetical protein